MGQAAPSPSEGDLNYEAFKAVLPEILAERAGQFALMHSQQIVDYFASSLEATIAGLKKFGEGRYSVQEVTDKPEHLGFYSYVGGTGNC